MKYAILLIFVAFQAHAQSSVDNSPDDLHNLCQRLQGYWVGGFKKNEHVLPQSHPKYPGLSMKEACSNFIPLGGGLKAIKAVNDDLFANCPKEPVTNEGSMKTYWADSYSRKQERICIDIYGKTQAFLDGVESLVPSPKCDFSPKADRLRPKKSSRANTETSS